MLSLRLGKSLSRSADFAQRVSFINSKSISLNGTNQYVDTNYDTDAGIQGSFTISQWVKPTDGQPSGSSDIIFGVFQSFSPTKLGPTIQVLTSGKLSFSFMVGSDTHTETTDAVVFADGAASSWTHVAFVWTRVGDSDAGTAVFYINGSAVASTATLGNGGITGTEQDSISFVSSTFFIGAFAFPFPSNHFPGLIDEVAFFREALSAAGISEIYNSGVPTDLTLGGSDFSATNLELYYRLEDDVTDTTGTSDGTAVNSPTFSTDVPE